MKKRILVLAPHPDDGEFGAGASLKKWIDRGAEVWYAAFSPCNKSLPEGFSENAIYEELAIAVQELGIKSEQLKTYNYPVRAFPKYRQEILEDLVQLNKEISPDLVLMPNSDDLHQDHHQIYLEGRRAFKTTSMLGYELPWNNLNFTSNYHVAIDEAGLAAKVKAVNCYVSQGFRNYSSESFIRGWAQMRGVQIKERYAEGFEMIRWIE